MTLVSTEWLSKNHSKVKIIDASWHLIKNRNAIKEFENEHIENAIFFDLDKSSSKKKGLVHGHFLPTIKEHEVNASNMGILNSDYIVIYCNSDLISSCRAWFQFIYFGHDPKLVSVLNGGLKKWKLENREITNRKSKIIPSTYVAKENVNMIKTKSQIDENINKKKFTILDARSKNRFLGLESEPRPGIRSGSINGSKSLPLSEVLNTKDNTFLDKEKLRHMFDLVGVNKNPVVMSCGSSVSASTLALAYSLINDDYTAKIYIGSWTEYGKI